MDEQNTALATIEPQSELQMIPLERLKENYNNLVNFTKSILKDGQDFGTIPGVDKPSLLKPGAEKLRLAYGLQTNTELVKEQIDFNRPYLDFTYRTTVKDSRGRILGQCEGNTNSYEPKWRYVWVAEHEVPSNIDKSQCQTKVKSVSEFKFAVSKKETNGTYGKPLEYWHKFEKAIKEGKAKEIKRETKRGMQDAWEISSTFYRIPNPDIIGLKNTLMKMAQKRSYVGAIMLATGASEFFTQDVEDMKEIAVEEAEFSVVSTEKKEEQPQAETKPDEVKTEKPKAKKKQQPSESTVADELKDLGVNLGDDKPTEEPEPVSGDALIFRAGEIINGLDSVADIQAYATETRKSKDLTPDQKLKIVDKCNKAIKALKEKLNG